MKLIILIATILILIPSVGFSKITGIGFAIDSGFMIAGGKISEKSKSIVPITSVYLLAHIDNNEYTNFIFGYNNYLNYGILGIESVIEGGYFIRVGNIYDGIFGQFGRMFENKISITFTSYQGQFFKRKDIDNISYLSFEMGWRF